MIIEIKGDECAGEVDINLPATYLDDENMYIFEECVAIPYRILPEPIYGLLAISLGWKVSKFNYDCLHVYLVISKAKENYLFIDNDYIDHENFKMNAVKNKMCKIAFSKKEIGEGYYDFIC